METKITPMEFMQRLRERAEKAKAEGRTVNALPAQHSELIKKMRERAEKMRAEGKTSAFPSPNARMAEFIKRMKDAQMNKTEKKEE